MNYHNILHDDMNNGSGLRVTLFVSGCNHHCQGCQNPQTWDSNSGIEFDSEAMTEIISQLNKNHIEGITITGGDPLEEHNVEDVLKLCKKVAKYYPDKNIWLYTGYCYEQILYPITTSDFNPDRARILNARREILNYIDVLVDGEYIESQKDLNYRWAGSRNQRVISVPESIQLEKIVLLEK